MKKDIHPKYYPKAKVKCACGNTFTIGSTKEKMGIEICSKCHPFYTGKKHLVDIAGRAEKFKVRTERAAKAAKHEKTLKKTLKGTENKTKKK